MLHRLLAPALVVAMLSFGVAVYRQLPEQVPSHWNIQGEVDGTMARAAIVFMMPAIALAVWTLLLVAPRIDPRRSDYRAFEGSYRLFINAITAFLAFVHVLVLSSALGLDASVPRLLVAGTGLLIAAIGAEMHRVQPNWFAGIRTPWTMSNDEVWRRTHVAARPVFVAAGLLTAVFAVLLPLTAVSLVVLAFVGGAAIWSVVYSYLLYRRIAPGH